MAVEVALGAIAKRRQGKLHHTPASPGFGYPAEVQDGSVGRHTESGGEEEGKPRPIRCQAPFVFVLEFLSSSRSAGGEQAAAASSASATN